MVVIAIISVLAAVAAPAYKSYMISARAASVVPIIDSLVNKSIVYASTNGEFGSAYNFELNPTNNGSGVVNPSSLSPYFSDAYALGGSTVQKNCWYLYTDPNDPSGLTSGTGNLIPGWMNACLDSACATFNQNIAIIKHSSSYYNATCQ